MPALPVASKDFVLSELRRIQKSLGRVPGLKVFELESGLHRTQFIGTHWARWSDAVGEAGLEPNGLTQALPLDDLLTALAELALESGRAPTSLDLRFAARNRKGFPASNTFESRLGSSKERVERLRKLATTHANFAELLDYLPASNSVTSDDVRSVRKEPETLGIVYLFKEKRFYKLGRTNCLGRREYELGIQLPEKVRLIHQIRTDDPVGIESYWHNRFKEKRKNGEWFDLDANDVAAFKRRKTFM